MNLLTISISALAIAISASSIVRFRRGDGSVDA